MSGATLNATSLGNITTPTGTWPVSDLGPVSGGRVYQFGLNGRATWWSVCVVRYPVPGDASVGERLYTLSVNDVPVALSVLNGSMKCVDNGEPVAPSAARVQEAINDKRILPYSAAAFSGWPKGKETTSSLSSLPGGIAHTYRPGRIYGQSSSSNAIGVISGQGGEYHSSRGFVSGDDAQMIAAAVDGNSAMFTAAAARNRAQMLWSLSVPNLAIWSQNHNMLRDPQLPLSGDAAYVNEGSIIAERYSNEGSWTAGGDYPHLAEIGATAGTTYPHTRDAAHLLNHGYAYWLATGDPRAAILQQAIAAYALASVYRGANGSDYRAQFNYQRHTLNVFSALWKLRDVANNASGPLLWSKSRADKMTADVRADWKVLIAQLDGTASRTRDEIPSAANTRAMMSAFKAYDATAAFSDFMAQGYGPEAAYLWASAGDGALLRRLAEHFVIRADDIGGTRGIDEPSASTLITMDGSATTVSGIIAQIALRTDQPTNSFNGASPHTVQRAYWLLRLAKDAAARGWIAPVPGIDSAIAKMDSARAATTSWKYPDILAWKHAGIAFD